MTFREKLVRLRKIKGVTQDELASVVGVSRQAVYKWESGQSYPEALKLVEIKNLLGISIDDLLDDDYEVIMPPKKKRISKAERERMAAEAQGQETAQAPKPEAPKPEAPKPAKAPKAPKKAAPAPVVEEPVAAPVVETPAPAPAPAPVVEEPVAAPAVEEPAAPAVEEPKKEEPKKVGFFARLFGNK